MLLVDYIKTFSGFAGRDDLLKTVLRYHSYKPMFYRSNLVTHAKHVLWLVQSILPAAVQVFGQTLDPVKAQLMAVVHDDPEVLTGDIERGIKNKMTADEMKKLGQDEEIAIQKLAARFPATVLNYNYADLIREGTALKSIEAKLVKYLDRFDAHGEALHEIMAGNRRFITPVINPVYGVIDLPCSYYVRYATDFLLQNPEFAPLAATGHILFEKRVNLDYESLVSSGRPHSPASVRKNTPVPIYNFWKNVVLKNNDPVEIANLYTQKEFAA